MKREDDRMDSLKADALRGFYEFRHLGLIIKYLFYFSINKNNLTW